MEMNTVKPGEELDRLLEFADGDEETLELNLRRDLRYWSLMLIVGLPFFMTARISQASYAWVGDDQFTF